MTRNLVQISMDGPNVNWKFHRIMQGKLFEQHGTTIMNLGSCGLHITHNAFKAGSKASEWNVSSLLSSMYYMFKDSPARREDFQTATGSKRRPLKFVNHRWLENVPVIERAIDIWPEIVQYIRAVKEKKVAKPTCKSFDVVKMAVDDPMIIAKMQFFKSVAMLLFPFLSAYQTDKPMVCFLAQDLGALIKLIMRSLES